MAPRKTTAPAKAAARGAEPSLEDEVQAALAWLERHSTKRDRENLARFGITANKAFGVSMANIQVLAKRLGRNHELAAALWDTGWYEARMLTSFVDEPARVTPAQMDRWCRDFDNWGICDTAVLPPVRPHAARLGQGRAVERPARRVRQARGLCAAREPHRARQDAPATSRSSRACASSSAPPPTNGTSSRRA